MFTPRYLSYCVAAVMGLGWSGVASAATDAVTETASTEAQSVTSGSEASGETNNTISNIIDGTETVTSNEAIDSTLPTTELDPIVVTASRTPTSASSLVAQTRVIDSEALQRYQGQTALDVLKQQAGVSFYQNGGTGTVSNFYMRGYDSKQVLVLIDGIRYSAVSTGQPALSLIPADQIERIEVVYGASGSSMYGADAMGGVIQVFTKRAHEAGSRFSVTGGAGSHDTYHYGASAQLSNGTTALSLAASHDETDGFNATLPSNTWSYHGDADGFESDNYSLALTHDVSAELQIGATGLYSESTTEFDNGAVDNIYSDQKNGSIQVFADLQYAQQSSLKLQYGHSIDDSYSNDYDSTFDSDQDQVSLVGRHQLPIGVAIYGAEYLNQSLDSSAYDADDRDVTSGFLGFQQSTERLDAQANLRYDDNSQYGDETTYNLGGAWHLTPALRLGASYAKGFRAPNFNELYYAGSGNPDLDPESSDNFEAFIEHSSELQTTRLTGYHSDVDDLIAYVSTPTASNPYAGTYLNINQAKIDGVTLTSDWQLDSYLFGLSYDYQKAKDDSGGSTDGNYLPIRPEHQGLVYVGYRLPSVDVRAEYQYTDDYYSNVTNLDSQHVDSYGLVNISGNYHLSPNVMLTARINNLTNKKYITLPGYNSDGTNFFTSLTYTWF